MESSLPKSASPGAAANSGKLVIEVDADCELKVDGQRRLTLIAGEASMVVLEAGQQLMECTSTQNTAVKVCKVQTVEAGNKVVLLLALAEKLAKAAAAKDLIARAEKFWESNKAMDNFPKAKLAKINDRSWVRATCQSMLQTVLNSRKSAKLESCSCGFTYYPTYGDFPECAIGYHLNSLLDAQQPAMRIFMNRDLTSKFRYARMLFLLLASVAFTAQAFDVPPPVGNTPTVKTKPKPEVAGPVVQPIAHAGKLVIEVDADCELKVDGQRRLTLQAGEASVVVLEAGQQLLECTSTQYPEEKVRQVQTVKEGEKVVLSMTLARPVREAAAQAIQAKKEREAAALAAAQAAANAAKARQSREAVIQAVRAEQQRVAAAALLDRTQGKINMRDLGQEVDCVGLTEAGLLAYAMRQRDGPNSTLRVLNLRTGAQRDIPWAKPAWCSDLSHDGKLFAVQNRDGSTNLMDLGSASVVKELKGSAGRRVANGRFSPDDSKYAYYAATTSVQMVDLSNDAVFSLPINKGFGLAWSPDGKMLATGPSDDGLVQLWDGVTGHALASLPAPDAKNASLAFSPDGKTLVAYGSRPRTWLLESSLSERPVYKDSKGDGWGFAMAFTPDSKRIVLADGSRAKLWNLQDDSTVVFAEAHGSVTSVAIGMNGKVVAYAGSSSIRLWDLERNVPFVVPLAP